jgi:hypothetical protein
LPIGIAHKARGRIEGEVGSNHTETGRIQRQQVLHTLQGIEKEHSRRIEEQHTNRVRFPAHVSGRIDLADTVDEAFDR